MNEPIKEYKWKDKKRTIFGLPLSFTTYILTDNKLIVEKGIFTTTEEEIRLYRVLDISLRRSLRERIFGLGTIHLCSSDRTTPEFNIKSIKKSREVKEMISEMIEFQRASKGVSTREFISMGTNAEHRG